MSIAYIPSSAPFNDQQRAWLNGFFAGLLSSMEGATTPADSAVVLPAPEAPAEEEFPWHDDSLSLDERLSLAEGKPLERQLMAAMAQLDCGACGYVCQTYSEAIAHGEEKDLTRCSPGGSETAKALRMILESTPITHEPSMNGSSKSASSNGAATDSSHSTYDRNHPYHATLIEARRLSHLDCGKDTRHIAINLADSGITYEPGDSLGILPRNCPEHVEAIIQRLGASGDELVPSAADEEIPFRDALSKCWTISRLRKPIVEFMAQRCEEKEESRQLMDLIHKPEEEYPAVDLRHILEQFPSARPDPKGLVEQLAKLQPRLYSISSSPLAHPGEVHLTVAVAQFEAARQRRNGVSSGYLGLRSQPDDTIEVYVQRSPKFRLPVDPDTPIIMVGPGTGIAPFRAFLEHRRALGSPGKNWLFFGNTSKKLDYLYQEELETFVESGYLTRLDTAFSRDQAEKIYVQHRMLAAGKELWSWLQEGAYFYVCGDAKRMAVDVDRALQQIAAEHGGLSADEARDYVKSLAKSKRYLKDVY